ncbi:Pentatricopeptide repeat-containing protein, partial [Thalictrum thalictroides]
MAHIGFLPNYRSSCILVNCFLHTQNPEFAFGVIGLVVKRGYTINLFLLNLILRGFCQRGQVLKAIEVFREWNRNQGTPDVITYNTLINGLCKEQKFEKALELQVGMVEANCLPDVITYSTLMDGLCKYGKVDEAMSLFDEMKQR